jgi:hypothetical protein
MTYYKFVGDVAGAKITPKQEFFVEVTDEEQKRASTYPYPRFMTAKIVVPPSSRYNFSNWVVGDIVNNFINPYENFHCFGYSSFIKISKDRIPAISN